MIPGQTNHVAARRRPSRASTAGSAPSSAACSTRTWRSRSSREPRGAVRRAGSRTDAQPAAGDAAHAARSVFASRLRATATTIRGTTAHGDVGPDLTHLATRTTLAARHAPEHAAPTSRAGSATRSTSSRATGCPTSRSRRPRAGARSPPTWSRCADGDRRRTVRAHRAARAALAQRPGVLGWLDDGRPQADRAPLLLDDARLLRRRRRRGAAHAHAARARRTSSVVGAGDLRPALHDARGDDDLLLHHPDDDRRVRELPRAADDRRARHGLPAAERAQLLALPRRRALHLLELPARTQAPNAGWFDYVPLALKRYDGGLNIDFYALGADLQRHLVDGRRDQLHRHDLQAARAGHVVEPDAALLLRDARGRRSRSSSRCRR